MKERLSVNVALVTDRDKWRLNYMARLLMERGEAYYRAEDEEATRLTTLIDSLSIN